MSIAHGRSPDLPGYCAPSVTLMRVGYTPRRSVHVSGFASFGLLTPQRRLYPLPVRRASALPPASFRRPVTRTALAVQLTVPRVGSVEDFHLQEGAPCRAHQRKSSDSHCESRLFRRRVFHDGPQSSPGRALPYRLSPGLPQLATVWGFTWFVWGRHLAAQKRRPGNRPLSLSVSFPQQ